MRTRVQRRTLCIGLGSLLGLACAVHAADPRPPSPDGDFLEFLGSGDDVDPELQQYLARPDGAETGDAKPVATHGSGKT